jgi:glutathione peroxidase-family protein
MTFDMMLTAFGLRLHSNPVKFLVDHEGNAYKRYASTPPSDDMRGDIESLLKQKEESS